jgi:hypothetical protein
MSTCNTCGVVLSDDNWQPSWRSIGRTQCKNCCNPNRHIKNPTRMYVNGKYISRKHPLYKPGRYKTFNDAAFDGTYKLENIKEGYVYAITNKAWVDWVKIGMAIDAEDRLNTYQTSSPHRDYVLEHHVASNDRRKSEREAHREASKLASEKNGEWFKLSVEQAINILDNLNEHGSGTTEETNTVTPQDKLQEQPVQGDLWPSS